MNVGSVVRSTRASGWREGVCVLRVPAYTSARYLMARRGFPVCHVRHGVVRDRESWVVRVVYMVKGRWRDERFYWPKGGTYREVR